MQKLTVIKAKALLQDLGGLRTIREELFRQALEIALPILEQQAMITDSQPVITDSAERESFEDWFRGAMHLGGRCFVDKPTKRRMWRAWQAATARHQERATNQNGEQ